MTKCKLFGAFLANSLNVNIVYMIAELSNLMLKRYEIK